MPETDQGISREELSRVVAIAREAALDIIMPRFRRLGTDDVRTKGSVLDLVTVADELAEEHITTGLRAIWPDALIVGEEVCSRHAEIVTLLPSAQMAITIDPIDGTANYAAGVPLFGVMIGILLHGAPVASVILDPVTMDAAVALRGEGAWMDRGNHVSSRPLKVAQPPECISEMTGKAAWRNLPSRDRARADQTFRQMASLWDFRCAAHEYLLTAEGRGHILLYTRSLPWDHVPGWLLLHEAGGYGAQLDGRAYDLSRPRGGLLYAPDRESWDMMHEALAL